MKNAVLTYFGLLAFSGLVALGVLGGRLLEDHDRRGLIPLAFVLGGMLLTLVYGIVRGRRTAPLPAVPSGPEFITHSDSSTAEYAHSPADVWALIKPAEAAMAFGDQVIHAFSVPGIPDGPGERQCFFLGNGQIHIIEVVEEIPERLAVTEALFPTGPCEESTTYRLEPTPLGCRFTYEVSVAVPRGFVIDAVALQDNAASFVARVGELLDRKNLKEGSQVL
ncbi:hypothetical protein [Paenarthrobacter ilicis]|uniref:hypothetical protein n=1 Tax=Paenarthrobacter ilicis TaxID=43665 RepID=UPI0028CFF2A2|nr:hypothetical protein [Paenarthrobacter ilicis]